MERMRARASKMRTAFVILLVVGIIGAFIGGWLLPRLGIHLGVGISAAIFDATVGAIVLLLVVRLVRGSSYWEGSGWSRRWGWGSRRY